MSEPTPINWPGASGAAYTHYIYPRGQSFTSDVPGNYVYAKETKPGTWEPIYIGQTKNLNQRQQGHEKKPCLDTHGATHVHVCFGSADEATRRRQEDDQIALWQPPCNEVGIRQAARSATTR